MNDKLDFAREVELLRSTKEQLIEYIFYLRRGRDERSKEDGKLWDAISYLKRCEQIKDIWDNCD